MKLLQRKRPNSVLGLNLADGLLSACLMTRTKGVLGVSKSISVPLTLELERAEPAALASELRSHLAAAGLRETHCVVAIPPAWILSQQSKLPELSAEDLASFLQLEAEKGFPCDTAQLQIAQSFFKLGEQRYVTQLAVRKEQLERLTSILKNTGLKPVSFTLGLTALRRNAKDASGDRVCVALENHAATLLVTTDGGIATWRCCDLGGDAGRTETSSGTRVVARELRITFEQLPEELRSRLNQIELLGEPDLNARLSADLAPWAQARELAVNSIDTGSTQLCAQMAEACARGWLDNGLPALEFLPAVPNRWAAILARYHSRRLSAVGYSLAAVVALTLLAFTYQEITLLSLHSEWNGMKVQVTELEGVQSLIRGYRPWYDTSFRNLTLLKRVTESFPDNGSVTAKSVEIHGPASVSISGTARDNASLLKTLDQLRRTKEIQGLKVEQIRGKAPLQFTLSFRWTNLSGS